MSGVPGVGALVLLRHGESEANTGDVFAGWVDVDLTLLGREQALQAGRLLAKTGLAPTVVHTSLLSRAVESAQLAVRACAGPPPRVRRSWRLNERHYGDLQGRSKDAVLAEFGPDRYSAWRRSASGRPPRGRVGPGGRPSRWTGQRLPRTEALADLRHRLLPYWSRAVLPDLRRGRTVWVVSHGNTLRVLIQHLQRLDDSAMSRLDVPNALPMVFGVEDLLAAGPARGRVLV